MVGVTIQLTTPMMIAQVLRVQRVMPIVMALGLGLL